MHFVCPKCREQLEEVSGSAVCKNGHSYDKSKYGYYNLLLGGGAHGDNREMVVCRRRFLESGHYRPLADAVAEAVLEYTSRDGLVLDTGCGEGYYTDVIERALFSRDGESRVCAFDISKDAVTYAARRNKRLMTAVFGSYHMPISDGVFSVAVNMFSPNALSEINRVLARGGIYVMVIPAEEHLYSLKAAIYENPYKNTVEDTELSGFDFIESRRVSYKIELRDNQEIRALFGMTPYAYRTKKSDRENIESLGELTVEADFIILIYRKSSEV